MPNWRQSRILITGASGFVGFNLSQRLSDLGLNTITTDVKGKVDILCDLSEQQAVRDLFDQAQPEAIFHVAAKVGGIYANVTQKSDFYLDNTLINTHVLAEVQRRQIKQVYAMGAGCAYPKQLEGQMLHEADFMDGPPEVTNDSYAYTKRNMLVHLQALAEDSSFRYLYFIPSNIYGPHDNFHPTHSHVVAGLIARLTTAKQEQAPEFSIWGDGSAQRDLLFVEDLIDAMLLICDQSATSNLVNVATGQLTSIADLAYLTAKQIGYFGTITTDLNFPAGQKLRTFDTTQITQLGWQPQHTLNLGLTKTIDWYRSRQPAEAIT